MRASSLLLLTLIFTAAEYPLHTSGVNGKCKHPEQKENYGNLPPNISYDEDAKFRMPCIDGFVREAGTSNLFRCKKNDSINVYSWNNFPELKCKPDPKKRSTPDPTPATVAFSAAHTTAGNPTLSTPGTQWTVENTADTSTTAGQTAFTTTHTVPKTAGTFQYTSLKTTTKEEEPMTSTNSITVSSLSTLTDRKNLTTDSPKSTSLSNISTTTSSTINISTTSIISTSSIISNTIYNISTTTNSSPSSNISTTNISKGDFGETDSSYGTTSGIATGTVLILIVITGSAVGIFIWCRRKNDKTSTVEMTQVPGVDCPLLDSAPSASSPPDSAQNTKTDPLIVVQEK